MIYMYFFCISIFDLVWRYQALPSSMPLLYHESVSPTLFSELHIKNDIGKGGIKSDIRAI